MPPRWSLMPAARDRETGGLINIQQLSQSYRYLLDFWEVVAGTPGRSVEATSCCRGWLAVSGLVMYPVIFMANPMQSVLRFLGLFSNRGCTLLHKT